MSPAQHRNFYLPAWWRAARANNWHNLAALALPLSEPTSPLATQLLAGVRGYARALAMREHRAERPDDYRHACHIQALGKNKSSLAFTNDECERVVNLFRVLAQPDNLAAVQDWQDPERAKKRNLIAAAKRKAPIAYIISIMEDKFHTSDLEDLTVGQLGKLCFTLNQRREKWAGRTTRSAPAAERAEAPF